MAKSAKERLDFRGIKSADKIAYPLERVENIVSKLKSKFITKE